MSDKRDVVADRAMFEEMRDTEAVYVNRIKENAETALDYITAYETAERDLAHEKRMVEAAVEWLGNDGPCPPDKDGYEEKGCDAWSFPAFEAPRRDPEKCKICVRNYLDQKAKEAGRDA
jgi:hypothetical protein